MIFKMTITTHYVLGRHETCVMGVSINAGTGAGAGTGTDVIVTFHHQSIIRQQTSKKNPNSHSSSI